MNISEEAKEKIKAEELRAIEFAKKISSLEIEYGFRIVPGGISSVDIEGEYTKNELSFLVAEGRSS